MRKTYCCFQFNGEFEILKLKLEELWDTVDCFVINESNRTHSGLPKHFYFPDAPRSFDKHKDKIIYQMIMDTPKNQKELLEIWPKDDLHENAINKLKISHWFDKSIESYFRDAYEKEYLIRGLTYANNDDIIVLGDCDEIPNKNALRFVLQSIKQNEIYNFEEDSYWYYLNLAKTDEKWLGNMVMSFETFLKYSFAGLRNYREGTIVQKFNNVPAGWHFTYQGGTERIKNKLESFSHQEVNQNYIKENIEPRVKNCLENGMDLFSRPAKFERVNINYPSHPFYLFEHQDEYRDFILEM